MSPEIWAAIIAAVAAVVAAVIGAIAQLKTKHKGSSGGHQGDLVPLPQTRSEPGEGPSDGSPESPLTASQMSTVSLQIEDDGHFAGGDRERCTEIVLELLDQPKEERRVIVRATPLADQRYKSENPNAYAHLRERVRMYEKALNLLFRGGVFYYWKWQHSDLVEAALELRNIMLHAQRDRETWYVWPQAEPSEALRVLLTSKDAHSIRSGYYQEPAHSDDHFPEAIRGVPSNEPIWVSWVFPQIVWGRIVPAVIARQVERNADSAVDISRWVISDRQPLELDHAQPTDSGPNTLSSTWVW